MSVSRDQDLTSRAIGIQVIRDNDALWSCASSSKHIETFLHLQDHNRKLSGPQTSAAGRNTRASHAPTGHKDLHVNVLRLLDVSSTGLNLEYQVQLT